MYLKKYMREKYVSRRIRRDLYERFVEWCGERSINICLEKALNILTANIAADIAANTGPVSTANTAQKEQKISAANTAANIAANIAANTKGTTPKSQKSSRRRSGRKWREESSTLSLTPEEADRILEEHREESQSSQGWSGYDEELERELLELERMLEEEERRRRGGA